MKACMRRTYLTATVVCLAISCGADADPAARNSIELVTHSTVMIQAGAAEIWPHIVDPNAWKQGSRVVHHSGPQDAPGGIFKAVDPGDGSVAFYVENVEFVPHRRRTIKLYLPDNGALLGYATWVLDEQDGATQVSYHVYSETLLSAEQAVGEEQLAELERSGHASNKARFDRELVALKDLVEGN